MPYRPKAPSYAAKQCTLLLIADEKGKFDELVEQNGVQVLIDSPALMHLFGTKIDFVQDRLRYITHTCLYSVAALYHQLVTIAVTSLLVNAD